MTASQHVVTKLLTDSIMSEVDYRNKVLAKNYQPTYLLLFYLHT